MLPKIAAVVVHHKSYTSIANVVEAILRQGVLPQNLLVIDNSEEPNKRAELRELICADVELVFTSNLGYGAAVNQSLDYFADHEVKPQAFLVSTHEARPENGALQALWQTLVEQPSVAVAGPTLVSGASDEFVWSTGGYLETTTGIPKHHDHRASLDVLQGLNAPEPREWLDGAFLLYRWEDISEHRMPEHYFLYMEETDLHQTFRKAGRDVVWVPQARVWQDSQGIPPYYFARNIRLLLRAHGQPLRWIFIPPLAVARRVAGDVLRGRGLKNVKPYLLGLVARMPSRSYGRKGTTTEVLLINPLGAALHHYEHELVSVLTASGASVRSARFMEPSSSGKSALSWLVVYMKTLLRSRFALDMKHTKVLVLWPVLGFIDVVLFGLLGLRNASLVMHDPHPLVRSVGYSDFSRRLASICGGTVRLIAHSQSAQSAIGNNSRKIAIDLLPHPILEPRHRASKGVLGERPTVRVLGQYKADRDLQALSQLGVELSGIANLEVHGRGWPAIRGWNINEGFVPEDRLDELMADSAAVVIPYKRFFQSGIAIRALEVGTPFVGPKDSVLGEMLGKESSLLVAGDDVGDWTRAVRHAIENGNQEALRAANGWRRHNLDLWSNWANGAVSSGAKE